MSSRGPGSSTSTIADLNSIPVGIGAGSVIAFRRTYLNLELTFYRHAIFIVGRSGNRIKFAHVDPHETGMVQGVTYTLKELLIGVKTHVEFQTATWSELMGKLSQDGRYEVLADALTDERALESMRRRVAEIEGSFLTHYRLLEANCQHLAFFLRDGVQRCPDLEHLKASIHHGGRAAFEGASRVGAAVWSRFGNNAMSAESMVGVVGGCIADAAVIVLGILLSALVFLAIFLLEGGNHYLGRLNGGPSHRRQ